jgi:hypothetical protein
MIVNKNAPRQAGKGRKKLSKPIVKIDGICYNLREIINGVKNDNI